MWLQDKRDATGVRLPDHPLKGVTARRNRGLRDRSSLPREGFDSPLLHNLTKFYSIMIDIKQLSIGDWVQHYTAPCKIRSIIRKAAISDDEVIYVVELTDPRLGDVFCDRLSSIRPLPITPEIMANIGFWQFDASLSNWRIMVNETHRVEARGFSEDYMTLYYERLTDCGEWVLIAQMDCTCVHHLQRFVTICNIHKEITL